MSKEVENILGSDDPHPGGDLESGRRVGLEVEGILVNKNTLTAHSTHSLYRDSSSVVSPEAKLEREHHHEIMELALRSGHDPSEAERLVFDNIRSIQDRVIQDGHGILFAPIYPFGSLRFREDDPDMMKWAADWPDAARKAATAGLHLHQEFRNFDYDEGYSLYKVMRAHSPLILAQSANSPFTVDREWRGNRSERSIARAENPWGGAPETIPAKDGAEFREWYNRGVAEKRIDSLTPTSWDVRPPRVFGTVEVTAYDISEDPRDWFAQLDLYHAVAMAHAQHFEAGKELPRALINPDVPQSVLVENRQRAVRDGMEAVLVDGQGRERSAKEMTERWLRFLEQVRVPLRRAHTREHVTALLDHGSRAERMVREYEDRMGRPLRTGEQVDIDVLRDMYRDRLGLSRRIIEDPLAGRPANGRKKLNGHSVPLPYEQPESAVA